MRYMRMKDSKGEIHWYRREAGEMWSRRLDSAPMEKLVLVGQYVNTVAIYETAEPEEALLQ